MAFVRNNVTTTGLSGAIGSLIFRQYNGKTIVSKSPKPARKQSEQQREHRSKFKMASLRAKLALNNPDKKAYYTHKAKKLKLPNAYTAALTDFMRKTEIKEIDSRLYKGKAGDTLKIKVHKKDFTSDDAIAVTLTDANGTILERRYACKKSHDVFIYKAMHHVIDSLPITIRVSSNGGSIEKELKCYLNSQQVAR